LAVRADEQAGRRLANGNFATLIWSGGVDHQYAVVEPVGDVEHLAVWRQRDADRGAVDRQLVDHRVAVAVDDGDGLSFDAGNVDAVEFGGYGNTDRCLAHGNGGDDLAAGGVDHRDVIAALVGDVGAAGGPARVEQAKKQRATGNDQ